MAHQRFVDNIAKEYFKLYSTGGFSDAAKYADRVIGKDAELQARVRSAVEQMMKGGKTSA